MTTLTRGQLAKRCGVHFETIRYYEQRGLLKEPLRSEGNYRLYPPESIQRVRFVTRAQDLGFTLDEIRDLLSLRARRGAKCTDMLARAEAKIDEIDKKVRVLESMRRALVQLKSECRGELPVSACPILEALGKDEEKVMQ